MHAACAPARTRPAIELADVVRTYGKAFVQSQQVMQFTSTARCQLDVEVVRVAQVLDHAIASADAHRIDTDLDPSTATLSALLHALGPHGEAAIVHVPDR